MNKKIAIVGGGVSGILAAKMLARENDVFLIERSGFLGGLLASKTIEGG